MCDNVTFSNLISNTRSSISAEQSLIMIFGLVQLFEEWVTVLWGYYKMSLMYDEFTSIINNPTNLWILYWYGRILGLESINHSSPYMIVYVTLCTWIMDYFPPGWLLTPARGQEGQLFWKGRLGGGLVCLLHHKRRSLEMVLVWPIVYSLVKPYIYPNISGQNTPSLMNVIYIIMT